MGTIQDTLNLWPRNKAGEVLMKTSEQAIFYGTLIHDKPARIKELQKLRKGLCFDIRSRMKKKHSNLDFLMTLALKAQFYRECIEEVDRLNHGQLEPDKEGK